MTVQKSVLSQSAQVLSSNHAATHSLASVSFQVLSAMAFGAVVLFAVGFLPMEAVHNAAHDVRHALAFPCH